MTAEDFAKIDLSNVLDIRAFTPKVARADKKRKRAEQLEYEQAKQVRRERAEQLEREQAEHAKRERAAQLEAPKKTSVKNQLPLSLGAGFMADKY